MRIFRRGWRAGWIGWLFNIHSPSAHAFGYCWCKGTRRELVIPNFITSESALADMAAYYRFLSAIQKGLEEQDGGQEHEGADQSPRPEHEGN